MKNQKIASIDEKISFLLTVKLKSIKTKINFHVKKLKEYTLAVNKLYKESRNSTDNTTLTISSIQMVNYQNLILNSQNKIEDLKIAKQLIETETIPRLKREKENITNTTIRKLQYKLDVELVAKKIKLNEKITELKFNISDQNIQNSKVVGEYIVKENPVKPKKKLIVVVGFITGLMLSIFLVFFLEFIQGTKRESDYVK